MSVSVDGNVIEEIYHGDRSSTSPPLVSEDQTVSVLEADVVISNLVYRPIECVAEDVSGNGLDGTASGCAATTGLDGSGALYFDGEDDFVEFPAAATADILGSNPRTVCFWAKVDSFDDGGALFSYSTDEGTRAFGTRTGPASLVMDAGEFGYPDSEYVFDVDLCAELTGTGTHAADGDWHQYCSTYDGTDWVQYFDAIAVWTKAVTLATADKFCSPAST